MKAVWEEEVKLMDKICETCMFYAGNERQRELRMSWAEWWIEKGKVIGEGIGESTLDNRGTGTRMRLTKRKKELIPETRWSVTKGAISYYYRGWWRWPSKSNDGWRSSAAVRGRWTEMRLWLRLLVMISSATSIIRALTYGFTSKNKKNASRQWPWIASRQTRRSDNLRLTRTHQEMR